MGGIHSGPHSLGDVTLGQDTLWVQERQRHKHSQEGGRYENFGGSSGTTQEQKLLKRSRSLAVISEENRNNRDACYFRLGEPSDACRRQQLIPRAKLINRHSLKDRLSRGQHQLCENPTSKLYHSHLTCDTFSTSIPPASLPNPISHSQGNRNPDRLNILNWPEPPKRYQSVQALDSVSGLVDIVEDSWPGEENRSVDCIYTQVKRKRKEHRSLDSVLFEDESELEYFDVLDLLPLSNVRLEFGNSSSGNNNSAKEKDKNVQTKRKVYKQASTPNEKDVYGGINRAKLRANDSFDGVHSTNNVTDEEKYKNHTGSLEPDIVEALNQSKIKELIKLDATVKSASSKEIHNRVQSSDKSSPEDKVYKSEGTGEQLHSEGHFIPETKKHILVLETDEDKYRADVVVVTPVEESRPVEESEDYKSIWISDSEEPEEMSRRPQVLQVVDNDVTKRNRHSTVEFENMEEIGSPKSFAEVEIEPEHRLKINSEEICTSERKDDAMQVEYDVGRARNFFETKGKGNLDSKNKRSEGKFERIIKETSSIFGKACNAVKGSLGFEARSESSDLGLGSESGSDTRRQSVDDSGDVVDEAPHKPSDIPTNENENSHSVLTRSRSCADSVKDQDGPEFNHIRYKIMKSDMFSKNMFGSMKKDVAFDGLMQYLQEYSFQDLLVDNNVVIIEPVRAEPMERKPSPMFNQKKHSQTCRIAGAIQKKSQKETVNGQNRENQPTSPKQTSLRRHFFYHPIRVNRELIDNELPDPDTVRNVRKMFETTLKLKTPESGFSRDCPARKSMSMKDLSQIDDQFDVSEKTDVSRSSSRAKDLTRLFENLDKLSVNSREEAGSPRSESKARIIAQSFEARSGQTSPSDCAMSKNKVARYLHNWDAGSVSSGVSSDYPDTDPGSGLQCTSSEDEEECLGDDVLDNGPGHFVSQDVLKKIREHGTSVTYYGGKVINTCNSPLISPMAGKIMKKLLRNNPNDRDTSKNYVRFQLVKSNSCDSRLELTGRLVNDSKHEKHSKNSCEGSNDSSQIESPNRNPSFAIKSTDVRQYPIMETPSIEITSIEELPNREVKKEPPIVIGLEPKKEEVREPEVFRADFKLGKLEDTKCYANKFNNAALNQWQVNEKIGEKTGNFGEIDFEEFEVLHDSLNATN